MAKKPKLSFEVRWVVDTEKHINDMHTYATESEAKKYAASISEEFGLAQIGKIETDADGKRHLTYSWKFDKGEEFEAKEQDRFLESETVTSETPEKESKVSKTATKKSTAKKPAKVAKKGAAKKPAAKRAPVAPKVPKGPKGPVNLSTTEGIIAALDCRPQTVREKLIKALLKVSPKSVTVDKLRVAMYGDTIEHNSPVNMSMLGLMKGIESKGLKLRVDKTKEGKTVSYALVRTK